MWLDPATRHEAFERTQRTRYIDRNLCDAETAKVGGLGEAGRSSLSMHVGRVFANNNTLLKFQACRDGQMFHQSCRLGNCSLEGLAAGLQCALCCRLFLNTLNHGPS
jgi:hypothetical protein